MNAIALLFLGAINLLSNFYAKKHPTWKTLLLTGVVLFVLMMVIVAVCFPWWAANQN